MDLIAYTLFYLLCIFLIKVLKYTFSGSNFKKSPMFWNKFFEWGSNLKKSPMIWNVFFEGAILKPTDVLKYIFWGSNFKKITYVLKCIFWGRNYFIFDSCLLLISVAAAIYISWLLNGVTVALCFFIKVFTTSKISTASTCINMNPGVIVNWLQSSKVCGQRHMLRMIVTPWEIFCFPRYECGWPLAWHGVP